MVKRIILFFILIFLFSDSSFAGKLLSREAVIHYNEGVKEQRKGNTQEAISLYKRAMLLGPDEECLKAILNNTAVINAQKRDFKRAEYALKRALEIESDYHFSLLNLGLVYDKRSDKVSDKIKAIKCWLKACDMDLDELKPKNFVVWDEEDFAGKRILLADPQDYDAQKIMLNCIGIIYAQKKDLRLAQEKFKEALALDPNYTTAGLNIGLIYDRQSDKMKAMQHWLDIFNIDVNKIKPEDFVIENELPEVEGYL